MSFEGYVQHVCANGHRFDCHAYDDDKTCHCDAKSVFSNLVDDTNCDEVGVIPDFEWDKLRIVECVTEECSACKHVKVIEEARYRVPTSDELSQIQYYRRDVDTPSQVEYVLLSSILT